MKTLEKTMSKSIGKGVGTHLVLELWGCTNLNDVEVVERALRDIVTATNVNLLDLRVYPFEPIGVTGVAIVSESHIMIHTWPEHGYAAVDIFTCGEERDLEGALDVIRREFTPERIQMMHIVRGIVVE
jgi:S-adenosylmethionine decarboxylase